MPRDAVTGCVPHAVTALPASLPIRPLLAAFLAAGTPQPHGAVAVAGGRVTCSSTGTVAVLLAVGPMETRGTTWKGASREKHRAVPSETPHLLSYRELPAAHMGPVLLPTPSAHRAHTGPHSVPGGSGRRRWWGRRWHCACRHSAAGSQHQSSRLGTLTRRISQSIPARSCRTRRWHCTALRSGRSKAEGSPPRTAAAGSLAHKWDRLSPVGTGSPR